MSTINLGDTARDTISGFTGVVTARYEYLNGCVRFELQSTGLHEGKPIDGHIFDEPQLELVQDASRRPVALVGGPRDKPARPSAPRR